MLRDLAPQGRQPWPGLFAYLLSGVECHVFEPVFDLRSELGQGFPPAVLLP